MEGKVPPGIKLDMTLNQYAALCWWHDADDNDICSLQESEETFAITCL